MDILVCFLVKQFQQLTMQIEKNSNRNADLLRVSGLAL
jgi:hypothetical protein